MKVVRDQDLGIRETPDSNCYILTPCMGVGK